MAFPAALTNAVDGVTEIIAAHLNNLEAKVGIDGSAVPTSLDYLLKNPASIDPGHKHSKLWASDGYLEAVTTGADGMVGIGTTMPYEVLDLGDGTAGRSISWGAADRLGLIGTMYAVGGLNLLSSLKLDKTAAQILYPSATQRARAGIRLGQYNSGDISFFNESYQAKTPDSVFDYAANTKMIIKEDGNVGIGMMSFGNSAAKVLGIGSGTAPTTAPADLGQLWVEDVDGAAGQAGLHFMNEFAAVKLVLAGIQIKKSTGDPTAYQEGLLVINTVDNTLKMYADGGWRQLASWT